MTVKEHVLTLLYENRDRCLSGEAIARTLGVTRTAIWKAVRALRGEGFSIQASTNNGYIYKGGADILSPVVIALHLKGPARALRIEKYDSVPSTNSLLRDRAAAGEPEGLVAVSEAQTAGRGRNGRPYFSPAGTGLYFSLLLRPACAVPDACLLTAAAAVAVCAAVERVSGKRTQIKWVNDILINGKKVCGILTEASVSLENNRLDYAVVGIGVNVFEPDGGFPDGLSDVAAAVFEKSEAHDADLRGRLAAEILNIFFDAYKNIGDRAFFGAYKERSAVIGKDITVADPSGSRPARALDIDGDCRLVVRYGDGTTDALGSGEISVRL